MGFGDVVGFGSMLGQFMDTAVSSSDRRATNELNYLAQMDTNKTNADINASQLAWAKELYKMQKAENRFLVDQAYERELENRSYNSPQNMKELYLRAGINPYLASQSGIAGGSHGSVNPSVGSPPYGQVPGSIPMQAAHFEPTMPEGLGLQKAIELFQMSQRNEADISAIRQRVANETAETKAKIMSMGKNDEYTQALVRKLNQEQKFNEESYSERMRTIQAGNDKMAAETEYQRSLTLYQNLVNEFTPTQQKLWQREYDVNYEKIQSAIRKDDSESALNYAHKAVEEANKKGLDISNEQSERLADAIVGKAYAEEDKAWYEAGKSAKHYFGGEFGYRAPIPGYDADLLKHGSELKVRRHYRGSHNYDPNK